MTEQQQLEAPPMAGLSSIKQPSEGTSMCERYSLPESLCQNETNFGDWYSTFDWTGQSSVILGIALLIFGMLTALKMIWSNTWFKLSELLTNAAQFYRPPTGRRAKQKAAADESTLQDDEFDDVERVINRVRASINEFRNRRNGDHLPGVIHNRPPALLFRAVGEAAAAPARVGNGPRQVEAAAE